MLIAQVLHYHDLLLLNPILESYFRSLFVFIQGIARPRKQYMSIVDQPIAGEVKGPKYISEASLVNHFFPLNLIKLIKN